ncbi:MAG: Type 1 glutamine amidotransferase-like domain-containing protein [Clostridia bacterium]
MKKLLLASSFANIYPLVQLLEKDIAGKRVTFIPTASLVETVTLNVDWAKKAFAKLGAIVDVLELATATKTEVSDKLVGNDCIYVSGGNTFFLSQELKKTGADKIVVEQVNNGKLYIGESAGAIITAPNIEYARDMDSVKKAPELENFDGLGLTDFYTLPHHINFPFKHAANKIKRKFPAILQLLSISNKEAIIVNGDSAQIKRI